MLSVPTKFDNLTGKIKAYLSVMLDSIFWDKLTKVLKSRDLNWDSSGCCFFPVPHITTQSLFLLRFQLLEISLGEFLGLKDLRGSAWDCSNLLS